MTQNEEIAAMCEEIARMVGFKRQVRKPGAVSVQEYAQHHNITETTARRHLERLVLQGKLVRDNVLVGARWRILYWKE